MINETHKRAVEMWVFSKLNNSETNPSLVILEHLTGQIPNLVNEPENTVQLCQKINEIQGLEDLTEDEEIEIQRYGIQVVENNKQSKNRIISKAFWLTWLNWTGYILGAISIGIGGFSWWILGFGVGTWWAHGAAKMAARKERLAPGPGWEMPAHIIIYLIAVIGLIVFSIYNVMK